VEFHFRGPVVEVLRSIADDKKVLTVEFLRSLTQHQLELFIETSIDADGWRTKSGARKIQQNNEDRLKRFEIACALAGFATSTSYEPDRGRAHLSILGSRTVLPVKSSMFPRVSDQAMTVEHDVFYDFEIWCPTVTHGNWLARRNGSVYFTGNTNHPSEILVFSEAKEKKTDEHTRLTLLSRFHLERISATDQVKLMLWLMEFYGLNAFSMDSTGIGLPLFQVMQHEAEKNPRLKPFLERIKGYNFSSKILVDFDQSIDFDEFGGDKVEDTGIKKRVLEYASDLLREYVDLKRLWMPNDRDLLAEFQGQTWSFDKSSMDMYGRKSYSSGSFHALDAARMAVLGQAQHAIEGFMREHNKVKPQSPVLDVFISP